MLISYFHSCPLCKDRLIRSQRCLSSSLDLMAFFRMMGILVYILNGTEYHLCNLQSKVGISPGSCFLLIDKKSEFEFIFRNTFANRWCQVFFSLGLFDGHSAFTTFLIAYRFFTFFQQVRRIISHFNQLINENETIKIGMIKNKNTVLQSEHWTKTGQSFQ